MCLYMCALCPCVCLCDYVYIKVHVFVCMNMFSVHVCAHVCVYASMPLCVCAPVCLQGMQGESFMGFHCPALSPAGSEKHSCALEDRPRDN